MNDDIMAISNRSIYAIKVCITRRTMGPDQGFSSWEDGDPGRSGVDNRCFVEAVIWVGQNGGKWRCLPGEYGHWNTVFQRLRRWAKRGIWQMVFNELAVSADTEWVMIDSTIVRAHQHAAGAKGGRKIRL